MTLSDRDRRALSFLAVAAVLAGGYLLFSPGSAPPPVVASETSIPLAERRLQKLRQMSASVSGRELVLRRVNAELAAREKGLIQADTAAQAQAQLLQIVRRVGRAQRPPIDLKGVEIGQIKAFGSDYGEVSVAASFDCRIEQLVNLLADLSAQKELIATTDMRIGTAHAKDKTMPVRLTLSGLVGHQLIPKKGGATGL